MVNKGLKYCFFFLFLLSASLLSASEVYTGLPLDTVFVFRKMPVDTLVVKKPVKPSVVKKSAPAKKNSKKAVKKSVKPKQVKKKTDSVKYAPIRYSLGDRVIMRGDSGKDVRKLAEIMVKHLFIEDSAVPYTKSGEVLYDGELVRAVKLFQKVSGLYDDGIVGETTIKALRKIHRWRRTTQ